MVVLVISMLNQLYDQVEIKEKPKHLNKIPEQVDKFVGLHIWRWNASDFGVQDAAGKI
jgi:hypothetical protein